LVDEQLQSADVPFQQKALSALQALHRQGKAVVLVTHELTWVEQIATRAIWLDKGSVVMDGDPAQVVPSYLQGTTV
jgi:teichoic acid transport system ATP-binding protein